jgi:DNA-binding transcriptional LysR family regulator
MDLRVLRFCEAIARLGSFTRAAEELHIAQPALSIAIAKLERELGVPLFFRHPRGVSATPEGEVLLARAARIFQEVDSMRREISDASDLRTGVVRVGLPPMYGLYYVPKLIMAFRARHPGIEIVAMQGSATEVRSMLEDGRIDIGILEARRIDVSLQSELIGSDEMVLTVAKSHPLAARKTVEPQALVGLPMVLLTEDFLQRQLFDAYCAEHKVVYHKVMECNFVHLTVFAAMGGEGAATLLRSLVTSQPGLLGLSFRPKISFTFDFCWRRDRYLSNAAQALVRFGRSMRSNATV